MPVRQWIDDLLRRQTVVFARFPIDEAHVAEEERPFLARSFIPRQTYFEARLSQMFLQHAGEYLRDFRPLASFVIDFLSDDGRESVPFLVGSEAIAKVAKVAEDDTFEIANTRVCGPRPYLGDDVSIFAALYRVKTNDWAVQALSLLETLGKTLDVTRLSSAVSLAEPIVSALEGFLGMRDVEMRLGNQRSYERAPDVAVEGEKAGSGALRPGYEVFLRTPSKDITGREQAKYWVRDGRLLYGDTEDQARPFQSADFLLVRIESLQVRDDYTTFDFHKVRWPRVQDHVWNGREPEARKALRLLLADLAMTPDIVYPHRNRLVAWYSEQVEEDLRRYGESAAFVGDDQGYDYAGPRPVDVREEHLRAAVQAVSSDAAPRGEAPEDLLRL